MAIITKYTYIKQVYIPKLITEISAVNLSTALQHIDALQCDDGSWSTDIWFVDVLSSADTSTLNTVISNHINAPAPTDAIRAAIVAARNFGQSLIDEVATDNVVAGITTSQVATILQDYGSIMAMLQSGSLYTALSAMEAATPDSIMTQDRINKYINQIKAYLGIS